jgi:ribonucleoside-diphosphate reductase alpha chain
MTGKAVFEQKDVEFPEGWSLNAINIVAQKYFTGTPALTSREHSLSSLLTAWPTHYPPRAAGRLL